MIRQFLATKWFALIFLSALASELTNSLLVHFPGFLLDLGADEVRIGTIVGASGLASIAVRPWIGRVMDRKSRRLMIRIGTAIVALATLSYAFIDQTRPGGGGSTAAARAWSGDVDDRILDLHRRSHPGAVSDAGNRTVWHLRVWRRLASPRLWATAS